MVEITEKVELIKFDEEKYLKEGESIYTQRSEVEAVVDKIAKEGYSNIFLLGIGGTEFEFAQFEYLVKKNSTVEIYSINAADANTQRPRELNKDSLVITASASGNTVEIVEAAKWIVEEGIRVVAFTKKSGPLGKVAQNVIEANVTTGQCEYSYVLQSFLIYGLLNKRGEFDKYEKFADQIKGTFKNLLEIRKAFEPRADTIAKSIYDAPYTIFTGSGSLWGETLLFTMCILEEMQWVRTRPVTSSQFFHGTLELIEPGVPVFIIKGEDEFRKQDTRVEEFCKKINAEYYVLDTQEFAFDGIDPEFRELIVPWIVTSLLTERLAAHYEVYTKHNLQYRRYYRQFEY
ncbi:SIS domain-containing protein [Marinilactibacillus psychrotolerans]|uniref:SIS domain-containing protein n=1 Tax=Marinilactibacillus psychrotolerans TaxID=191770 RepID=UPI0039B05E4A